MKDLLNDKKNLFIAVLVIILIAVLFISRGGDKPGTSLNNQASTSTATTTTTSTGGKTTGGKTTTTSSSVSQKCNLKVTYPVSGGSISFPLVIKGTLDVSSTKVYPCTWNQNAQAAGTLQLFYNIRGAGWTAPGIPVSLFAEGTVNATSLTLSSAILSLNAYALGIPSGTPIKLTFRELSTVSMPGNDTFDLIVYLK